VSGSDGDLNPQTTHDRRWSEYADFKRESAFPSLRGRNASKTHQQMLMHAEFAEVSGLVGELRVLLQDLVSPVGLEPTTNGLKGI